MQGFQLVSVAQAAAAERGPALDASPFSGLPVSVFGFQEKAGIDGEVQRGLILKADVDGVGLAGDVEVDGVHDFAFHLFHVVDRAAGIAADGGFASADDDRRRQQGQLAASAALAFVVRFGNCGLSGLGSSGLRRRMRTFTL